MGVFAEIKAIKSKIIDRIILVILIFLTPAYIASISRWYEVGWQNIYIVQSVLYFTVLISFFFRKRINLAVKIYGLILIFAILGLSALWFFAFSGVHYFMIISIALISILIERKIGYVLVAVLSLLFIFTGILYVTKRIDASVNLEDFSHSLSQWITISISLIGFIAIFIAGFGELFKELIKSIQEKERVKNELEKNYEELKHVDEKLNQKNQEISEVNLKLQISEERFKQLLKNSFDMIILLDSKGVQKYVSASCERILGYNPDELTDISVIEEMIHPEDQHKTREGFYGILENGTHGGTQYRHKHKDGGWVYLEAFGSNQIDNPLINAIILNVRDITDRKKVELALQENEARLSELNATKDKLFSLIAHDLKSPFNSMLGLSQLLNDDFDGFNINDQKKFTGLINRGIVKTYNLLEDLLSWTSSQQVSTEFNLQMENLHNIALEVADVLNVTAVKKKIEISVEIDKEIWIVADKFMLATIIRNLVSNALKFTKENGIITISAKRVKEDEREFSQICVKDTGVGIPAEKLAKLFDIGENITTSGTDNEKGTGLGLPMCKDFVIKHGGKIWVESIPGKGSSFFFTIPYLAHHVNVGN